MTNTIDWSAPLEAYHPDGRVVEVEFVGDGQYGHACYFNRDGTRATEWRIRNRPKPAPQYPAGLVERMAAYFKRWGGAQGAVASEEARAIADAMEAVDPDEVLAAEVAKQYNDSHLAYTAAFAAIKRVRGENDRAVHMSHCGQGEYQGSCKYGEDDCPVVYRRTSA